MILSGEKILPWLGKALDLSYQRHNIINGNIANADTAGFKARDIDFKQHLIAELQHGQNNGPVSTSPLAVERYNVEPALDGNTVDLDREVVQMTSNKMFYELTFEVMNRNIGMLRYGIDEGGR